MYNVVGMWRTKLPGGFTLIELLISIGLMAVLSAGVMTAIGQGPRQSQRDGRRKADIEAIRSGLELFRSDKRFYPIITGELVSATPKYINSVPVDPKTGNAYAYSRTPATCDNTTIRCTGYQICATLERSGSPYCMNNP
jgi:prepilin-type N-terminal cleavage/methylation domain-containing protein